MTRQRLGCPTWSIARPWPFSCIPRMHGFPCRGSMSKGLQSRIDADHHATHGRGGGASRAWAFGLSNFLHPKQPSQAPKNHHPKAQCIGQQPLCFLLREFCLPLKFVCLSRGAPRRRRLPAPRPRLGPDTPATEAAPRLAAQLRRPGASVPSAQAALLTKKGRRAGRFLQGMLFLGWQEPEAAKAL